MGFAFSNIVRLFARIFNAAIYTFWLFISRLAKKTHKYL